jgi:hypothetical protein
MTVLVVGFLVGLVRAETIEVRVTGSNNDAEERLGNMGMESLDSSDLEFGSENPPNDAEGGQLVGVRFASVGIPPASVITSAYIQFTVDENDKVAGPASYQILGQLSPNPAVFTSATANISSRPPTSNTVNWTNVPAWTGQVGQAGPAQRTPDLSSIVQEIINQSGWAAGNAMAFGILPLTAADINSNRTAVSVDGNAAQAALLHVDYVPEPSTIILGSLGLLTILLYGRRRVVTS